MSGLIYEREQEIVCYENLFRSLLNIQWNINVDNVPGIIINIYIIFIYLSVTLSL